jgi:hypothetical protein
MKYLVVTVLFIFCIFLSTSIIFGQDVTIDLSASDTTIAQGDTLDFDITLTNNTNDSLDVDLWFTILPDSGSESLIPAALLCVTSNPLSITLPDSISKEKDCWLRIPGAQDPGWYTMYGKVGDYVNIDSLVIDQDYIQFEVVEAGSLAVYPWFEEETIPLTFDEWVEIEYFGENFLRKED